MGTCACSDCRKPCGRRPFCGPCAKLLTDDEVWALRMASRSPAHTDIVVSGTDEAPVITGGIGWPWIDGTEEMIERWTEPDPISGAQLPCFHRIKGVSKIAPALHWLEYSLIMRAAGARIVRLRDRWVITGRGSPAFAKDPTALRRRAEYVGGR